MKILVVGGGGREHAIVRKLKENPRVETIYCAPGNGGISADAVCVPIKAPDLEGMAQFARQEGIDFAVVTPDDPLVLGMVDALNAQGIATFGPNRAAARIEGSKVFAKDLMKKYGIPTADYQVFSDPGEALDYIRAQGRYPAVIKADGLALGKGVLIAQSEQEAADALHTIMEEKAFGASGNRVVVEEFLTGPEVSLLCFCDGRTIVPMVPAMDHKRALDGDQGLNTGGMGVVAPNLCYTPQVAEACMEQILKPTVAAMQAEGCPFTGCLFFGLMITPQGPKVIEYNCRFGDPETQAVLPLLESDLLEIMLAVWDRRLDQVPVRFSRRHAACVVMASGGYPQHYETGKQIFGLDAQGQRPDAVIYHAGTRREGDSFYTAGGRVLGVTCLGGSPEEALANAYRAVGEVSFEGAHYRRDIGARNRRP
ncbi:MAG TPA: phosphoribosylamine--glycine ligase [Candidatus Anaerotruncus excrementipullorum]|uniref:Phosphoribosylamine--glycine ligase n=1 Tax=Candidatus Anaerotruncus excrementipullorum TaxID=2838465 RepID=A0A9D2B7I5_9FIRM|nr:phosphoribosylamine--glycine ligase [Candidatus Anaerotruncus excrementipullorum]